MVFWFTEVLEFEKYAPAKAYCKLLIYAKNITPAFLSKKISLS